MNKKKTLGIFISILIILFVGIFYYILTKQDKKTTLTLLEKQWIENSKNKIIDISILNEIPVINYSGEGIFFDFINSLEENTSLEFNKVSYTIGQVPKTEYALKLVDKHNDNQILIYRDNYALFTKNKIKYTNPEEISGLVIGVLNSDLTDVNNYLNGANVTYKTFETIDELFTANLVEYNEEENADNSNYIDGIIVLKTTYLEDMLQSQKSFISYNITEYTKDYVLSLGSIDRLNIIINKYYKKWYNDNYAKSFSSHLLNNYFKFNNIDEKETVKFRSKRYSYGFVMNNPYDVIENNKLYGINSAILSDFSTISNVEISYSKYDSYKDLVSAFNKNEIDFYFNVSKLNDYKLDTYNTIKILNSSGYIISHLESNNVINSITSLKNQKILTVKDTLVSKYLTDNKIDIVEYNNINQLLKNIKKDSIIAIDSANYDFYSKTNLKKYTKDYQFAIPNQYNYTIRDIKDNAIFSQFLDFYLSFFSIKPVINDGYSSIYNLYKENIIGLIIKVILPIIIFTIALIYGIIKIRKFISNRKTPILTKEDKLKYIDLLTSLKNRNYLNDNIENWDNSGIYPQTIIVIDLNNVAYVNDNYGHEAGDELICEAANVLINNQMENTEIIRTSGNEFLIYLVGYDEKQIISYIRKLTKEFKELSHGFGAAIGYSMINDAIKTIDDAVNEATLDMRSNKEEINN
ncbi:MAG TPA: GGDEF domain-containing protein [Tenericutes bacterium]|nr:GGDEF domain-containing protein [Mycoplasmatota bacterium]